MNNNISQNYSSRVNIIIGICIWSILLLVTILIIVTFSSSDYLLKDLTEKGQISEARVMQQYGDHFLNIGEYEIAVTQYEKAISIYPDIPEPYINLGIALKFQKKYKAAMQNFEKALEFEDVLHDATYYNIAEVLHQSQKSDLAVEYYEKSSALAPFPAYSYQRIGEIYNNMKQWEDAEKIFIKAINHAPDMQNSLLGMLKRDYHLHTDTTVKTEIRKLLETPVESYNFSSFDNESFDMALKHNFHMAGIYNQYGYTLAMTERYDEAINYFSMALEARPDFVQAENNLRAAMNVKNKLPAKP